MKERTQHSVWTSRTTQTQLWFVSEIAAEYDGGNGGMVDRGGQLSYEQ